MIVVNGKTYSEVQVLAKKLMAMLRCRKDGVLADSMKAKEAQDIAGWGVSIRHIRDIAEPYHGNEALAFELLRQQMREARLAAAFIFDPQVLDEQDMDSVMTYMVSTEMAEQFAMHIFAKSALPDVWYVNNLRSVLSGESDFPNNSHRVRAFLLSLGRIWRKYDKMTEKNAKEYLALLLNEKIFDNFGLEDQLAYAVDAILKHCPEAPDVLSLEESERLHKLTLLNYGSV